MDRGDGFDNRSGSARDVRVRAVRSSQEAVFQDPGIMSHLGSYIPDSDKLTLGLVNKSSHVGVARPHMIKKVRGMTREQVLEQNWNIAQGIEKQDIHGSTSRKGYDEPQDTSRGYKKGSFNIQTADRYWGGHDRGFLSQRPQEPDWKMDRGGYRAARDTLPDRAYNRSSANRRLHQANARGLRIQEERKARTDNRERRAKTKHKLEQSLGYDVVYPQGKAKFIDAYSLKRDSMNPFIREGPIFPTTGI